MENLKPTAKQANSIQMPDKTGQSKSVKLIVGGVFVLMVALGVLTGYVISGGKKLSTGAAAPAGPTASGKNVFGSADTKTFTDSATGTIEKGGISGEGTHKLVREGGPSQTACLVSSVLDLDEFVGKKVTVTSKTMDAGTCPWLMDVGRIEVLQ